MNLQSLGDRLISELVLIGHPRLYTYLMLAEIEPSRQINFYRSVARDLCRRTLRPGETSDQYGKLTDDNRYVSSLIQLLENFHQMYPQGADLYMIEMVVHSQKVKLFWALYYKLFPEEEPSYQSKRLILDWCRWYTVFEVAWHFIQDPQMEAHLQEDDFVFWMNYHSALSADRQPAMIFNLYRLAAKLGIEVDLSYTIDALKANYQPQLAVELQQLRTTTSSSL